MTQVDATALLTHTTGGARIYRNDITWNGNDCMEIFWAFPPGTANASRWKIAAISARMLSAAATPVAASEDAAYVIVRDSNLSNERSHVAIARGYNSVLAHGDTAANGWAYEWRDPFPYASYIGGEDELLLYFPPMDSNGAATADLTVTVVLVPVR